MPRKLKTYQTSMGFFDLAVAVPSMKAALEAWGSKNNLFHQGFAHEVDDIDVVSATMAKPGVVLKRPVGSNKPFSENPGLRASFPNKPAKKAGSPSVKQRRGFDDKAAAAKEYEREERKRDRERAKEEARRALREKAVAKVEAARAKAKDAHEGRLEKLQDQLTEIEDRIFTEKRDWQTQIDKFDNAVSRARK